jgi:hypothetical protein
VKTIEEMIAKAISIADSDENARVGFFGQWNSYSQAINLAALQGGTYFSTMRHYVSHTGGCVKFFSDNVTYLDISGCMFTHVFLMESVMDDPMQSKARLRSPVKHSEPMGAYTQYGSVTRTEAW